LSEFILSICNELGKRDLDDGVGYFPKGIYPRATPQVTISQAATSQMYIFPIGNFPRKEKRHFHHEGSIKGTIKFCVFKRIS